jgi:PKD repeat protein
VYTISLAAAGPGGSNTLTRTAYITTYEPVMVDFTAAPLTGTVPLTVTFTNSSTGASTYGWDFGDGSHLTQNSALITQNLVTHVYTQAGAYTVTLSAGNGSLTDTLTRPHYLTVTIAARRWVPLTTTTPPPVVSEHAMTYDPQRSVLVLYGGNATGWPYQESTWEFDGTDWLTVTIATPPPARYGAGLAFDSSQALLFGGSDENDVAFNQTWAYTAATWTLLTGSGPVSRTWPSLATGSNGVIYLFGGNNGEAYFNDLWKFENNDWTPVPVSVDQPAARTLTAMTYDRAANRLLLFGGRAVTGTLLADLWAFDLDTPGWHLLDDGGGGPAPRMAHSLTWDPATASLVLVGGAIDEGDTLPGDTWLYHDNEWTQAAPAPAATAPAWHQATYTGQAIRLVGNGEVWGYE